MTNIRTTKPEAGNKYFNRKATGGYSTCIQGKPTDPYCNVLANCVGYACGAFNEECNLGYEKYWLNCNAENFIERAIALGLSVVKEPVVGGIMVWQKGATLNGSDGAGHVAICTKKNSATQVKTAESGYGSTAFWTATRNKGNGNWGAGTGYTYRGCIVNPYIKDTTPTQPETDNTNGYTGKFKIGDKVVINGNLYVSSKAANPSGKVNNKITTITRVAENTAHPYNTTGDLGWINESDIKLYEEPKPEVKPEEKEPTYNLKVGDKVKIIGTGNGSADGDKNTAGGIGWTRSILKIYKGKPFPYQVGNSTGTTGFYQESSLQKI